MAICHFALQSISRGAGRSAIAAAAYRSGTTITDDRTGKRHNYNFRTKNDEVSAADTGVLLPADMEATWALDR